MNHQSPRVSVLMAVYKGSSVLASTIENILSQTFEDLEFVVVLDGPDPDLDAILSRVADPRLVVVTSPENVGVTKAMNLGLRSCRGEYVMRMDNGDICEPDRLETQLAAIERNKARVSFCHSVFLTEDGRQIDASVSHSWKYRLWQSMFCQSLGTSGPALMIETELLRSVGGFNEDFRYAQDYELYERLASTGIEFAYTDKVGIRCPLYNDGISMTKKVMQEQFARQIMKRAIQRHLPEVSDEQVASFANWRYRYRLDGDPNPALAVELLPKLGLAYMQRNDLSRLPVDVSLDIARFTEIQMYHGRVEDRRTARRVIFWSLSQAKSIRVARYALGFVKRLIVSKISGPIPEPEFAF